MAEHIIKLTPAAVAHIRAILAKNPNGLGFRLAIKTSGCSGYAYAPEIVERINPEDIHATVEGLPMYLDAKSTDFLQGTVVDFVEKCLGVRQLVFKNPRAVSECGCGESFAISGSES